jgi:2-polyprenyl-3-methyl-5-hydroxy-6-metoxy-1,4-benzoquinol methylase
MDASEQADLVRKGYDELSYQYRSDDAGEGRYAPWLTGLRERLPDQAAVLDLGCGCGVPVARALARAGHQVTGVDISDVQVNRARILIPQATFLRADAMSLEFGEASFDAVICLYALIHLPLADQPVLLRRIATWLRPSGPLLATVGQDSWSGTTRGWLGGTAQMTWTHADAATYAKWITQAGLQITEQGFVPEGDGGHALFWARRPAVSGAAGG